MSRQYEFQRRQKEKGLCCSCNEEAIDGWRCVRHFLKVRERQRKRTNTLAKTNGGPGRPWKFVNDDGTWIERRER